LPPELTEPPEQPAELPPPALYEETPTEEDYLSMSEAREAPEPARPEPPSEGEGQQAAAAEPAPPPPPQRRGTAYELSSWVLQVAALTELSRAQGLERDLRDKGFPAFIEQAKVEGKNFYRVRVGPEADRKRIQVMAESIRDKLGYEGQIKRYP
jgi:DedD protein